MRAISIDLDNADWPWWVQVIIAIALLSALVSVSAFVIQGATWIFFGHWTRGVATSAVLVVLMLTGVVSIGGTWGWVQDQWATSVWVTLAIIVLCAWPVWMVLSGIGSMWSSPGPESSTERCPACGYGAHGGAPCVAGPGAA